MIIKRNVKVRCCRTLGLACVAPLLTTALAVEVRADMTLGFGNITNNNAGDAAMRRCGDAAMRRCGDAAIGEAQLFVTVSDFGGGQVLFSFTNIGPNASSITDVYFDDLDDGTLLGIASLIDVDDGTGGDSNVDFSPGASPPGLPGGNTIDPPFEVTAGFPADSDPPASSNGVNPGESLGVVFDLVGGGTLADVFDELNDADLRIGIRVQGFEGDGSESFVNVPAPGAMALAALGLGAVAWGKRRLG